MKMFIASLIILAVIIGGGVWHACTIETLTSEMLLCCERLEEAALSSDYTAALGAADRMCDIWSASKPLMSIFSEHLQLMDIDLLIAQIRQYALCHESSEIHTAGAVLREHLKEIAEADRISWGNVL